MICKGESLWKITNVPFDIARPPRRGCTGLKSLLDEQSAPNIVTQLGVTIQVYDCPNAEGSLSPDGVRLFSESLSIDSGALGVFVGALPAVGEGTRSRSQELAGRDRGRPFETGVVRDEARLRPVGLLFVNSRVILVCHPVSCTCLSCENFLELRLHGAKGR
jgi:hypothetical protein